MPVSRRGAHAICHTYSDAVATCHAVQFNTIYGRAVGCRALLLSALFHRSYQNSGDEWVEALVKSASIVSSKNYHN